MTTTAPVLSKTKFIATQVLKVSPTDDPKKSTPEGAKTKITLSVPLAHGLNLSKGQVGFKDSGAITLGQAV